MTQEEKELLLKDLCARLPYKVKVQHFGITKELLGLIPSTENVMVGYDINDYEDSIIEDIKPYLRPMDSITDKEIDELKNLFPFPNGDLFVSPWNIQVFNSQRDFEIPYYLFKDVIDWLIAHYFDYYGLIPMGLALEAPEGMYKVD